MSRKKFPFGLNITYDAPAALSFAIFSLFLFAIDTFVTKQKIFTSILCSPTAAGGSCAFSASEPLNYLRLFMYVFGAESFSVLILNLIFILLLGPSMEERYGTIVIGIMIFVSALFSGVLNSCFCKTRLTGCTSVIFMMIFLNSFMSLSKKKIPLSFVMIFILFICKEFFENNPNGTIGIIINIAGGLCGSLFAFLTSPKARAAKKENKDGGLLNKAEAYNEEEKSKKPLFGKKKNDSSDATETVVGTLHFDD